MAKIEKFSFERLKEEADKKRALRIGAENTLNESTNILASLKVNPEAELQLMDFYSSKIPGLEFDPDISAFWKLQQEEIKSVDLSTPKNDYMRAYDEAQQYQDALDERERFSGELKENLDRNLENYDKQKKDAEKNIADAKYQLKKLKNETSPFQSIIQFFCGDDENRQKFKDANERIASARKRFDEILKERKLAEEKGEKQISEDEKKKNELKVKIAMAGERMCDSLDVIERSKAETKDKVDSKSIEVKDALAKQYAILDQYLAIQSLKKSSYYPAIYTILQSRNPELAKKLQEIPDNLPKGVLKISMSKPLTMEDIRDMDPLQGIDTEKIRESKSELEKISQSLPAGTDLSDVKGTLALYEIKETDTIESVQAELDAFMQSDPKGPDCKRLEMKLDYLKLQEKAKQKEKDIKDARKELIDYDESSKKLKEQISKLQAELDSIDPNDAQAKKAKSEELRKLTQQASKIPVETQRKLLSLKNDQDILKIIHENIKNSPYCKAVSQLQRADQLQQKIQEQENRPANGITGLQEVTEYLPNCNDIEPTTHNTVASLFSMYINHIAKVRQQSIENSYQSRVNLLTDRDDPQEVPEQPIPEEPDDGTR